MSANKNIKKKNRRKPDIFYIFRSFFKIVTAGFCIVALSYILVAGYGFITTCEYFAINDIVIKDINIMTKEEILKRTGIKEGVNILSINISKAVKVMLAHPWIADAEIRRELPKKIIITVREEKPIGIADIGRKYILNDNGQIIKEKEETDTLPYLPVILGLDFSDINAKLEEKKILIDSIIEILTGDCGCEELISKNTVDKILVDKDIGLTILGTPKVDTIKLGRQNFNLKCERLKKIISSFENSERIDFVDLTDLNRVVVKPYI